MNAKIIKIAIPVIIIIAIIAFGLAYYLKPDTNPLPQPVTINTNNQPLLGDVNAKIHIVAFEDLKCGNCMRYNTTIFPSIKKTYIDTGKAKYTMINVAFIPGSMTAANAARCVYHQDQKLFYPYIKYIYDHQPPETANWTTIPKLVQMAENIKGIDVNKLSECIYRSPYTNLIIHNTREGMKVMGGQIATPTVYINGVMVKPLTLKRFKQVMQSVNQ